MSEQTTGRRVATTSPPGRGKVGTIIVVILLLLAGGYLALCALCSPDVMPQGTTINGISVSGQEASQALVTLESQTTPYPDLTLSVVDSAVTYTLPGTVATPDYQSVLAQLTGTSGGFLTQGVTFLSRLLTASDLTAPAVFTQEGLATTEALLGEIITEMGGAVEQSSWVIQDSALLLSMGTPGRDFDAELTKPAILATLAAASTDGIATLVLESVNTDPDPVDVAVLYDQVYAEVANASLDTETFEIIESVLGVDFDLDTATNLVANATLGQTISIPLILTLPTVNSADLSELLFRDVLGEVSTYVSGTSNRASNAALGASSCNDVILLPGEIFSFNDTTGSRSLENGYLEAPAYINGESVDDVGGGICQVSSSIYYAALKSNLKIVERSAHMYAVGYVPDGMDATVYFGALDFQFENDTDYPIKIVATCENRTMVVQILGTKTDDIVVQMYTRQLSSTAYTTVYQIDSSLAAGTSVVDVTPYTGRKVEAYRELYSGTVSSENLISSTLETTSNYKSRDQVIRISPDDAASYGLNADGTPLTETPAETPTETPTETPVETPTESPDPAETTAPDVGDVDTGVAEETTPDVVEPSPVIPDVVETLPPIEEEVPVASTAPSNIPEGIPTNTGG